MGAPFNDEDYTGLITSYFRGKPRFTQTVQYSVHPLSEVQSFLDLLPAQFDLDTAIGVQLDQVGEWVGRTRYVNIPIASVWFSFNIDWLGINQGVWKGKYDPETGISSLDDETYRRLLRAKIAANSWDGTVESALRALDLLFIDDGTYMFIEDRQDMSMVFGIAGAIPNAVVLSLFTNGYVPLKPTGVRAIYRVTSREGAAIFGFNVNNQYVAGLNQGAWGVLPDQALRVAPLLGTPAYASSTSNDIVLPINTIVGATYRVTNLSVRDGSTIGTTYIAATGGASYFIISEAAQIAAYGALARAVNIQVRRSIGGDYSNAGVAQYDMLAPEALSGVAPTLALDVPRNRYFIGGGVTLADALMRVGGVKVVTGPTGAPQTVAANMLAFDYATGRRRLLLEGAATNLFVGSSAPTAAQNITVTAQSYTLSFWGTGSITLSGAASVTVAGTGVNVRTTYTFTSAAGALTLTPAGGITNVQIEVGTRASSYIATTTAAATRVTDVCALSGAAVAALVAAGPCTVTFRGSVAQTANGRIISVGANELIRRSADGLQVLGVVPLAQGVGLGIAPVGTTPFGIALGWDTSGGIGSTNGATASTNTATPSGAITAAYIGSASGVAGWIEMDEMVVWPAKGSAAAVQAQARAWI
ncbi:DUF2612 domain-containing protein [Xanthobacter sediminis]|uniref:DUF2612 domain-containing protein n=1 Tax=Xanthobacter sediminis TaxID=3119926 RepID=UPI00372BEB90